MRCSRSSMSLCVCECVCRVPGQRVGDLPGPAGGEESQHRHRAHVHLRRAAPPCGRGGERQGGGGGGGAAAGGGGGGGGGGRSGAVHSSSVYRCPV